MDTFDEINQIYDEHFGRLNTHENATVVENNEEDSDLPPEREGEDVIEQFLNVNLDVLEAGENRTINREIEVKVCNCPKDCIKKFPAVDLQEHVLNLRELEKAEKEFYVMGVLHRLGGVQYSENPNKQQRLEYKFRDHVVCKDAFCSLFDMGDFTLRALLKHIRSHGLTRREHGNKHRRPYNAMTYDDVFRVVTYIRNKGDEIGIPMPAAPRGSDGIPPVYLPASVTKAALHAEYVACCAEENVRAVKYSTFTETWRSCVSNIQIASPRDDVCSKCENYRKLIMDSRTECEKLSACATFSDHIATAQKERDLYRRWVKDTQVEGSDKVHYTFDFAQLVTVPHHGRQMGPLYFVTPRRVHVFGFRIDSIPRQINYLIDEAHTTGYDGKGIHGPNAVISMVDDGLAKFGQGEECGIHADNCFGQNKNWYVLSYMAWRIMVGYNRRITYMMQIPGHTKCLVDAGFASAKRLYRRTDADTVSQLADIFTKSSASNEAILYKDANCTDVSWEWRDWKEFLAVYFKPLKGISKYHYFEFSEELPGQVVTREASDGPECTFCLLQNPNHRFDKQDIQRPEPVPAAGLSLERQRYLFKNVRPHVREQYRDETCPPPVEE